MAISHSDNCEHNMHANFEQLGAGCLRSVFVLRSRSSVALKQLAHTSKALELENDFNCLQDLSKNFKAQGPFHLPKPFKHYTDISAFGTDIGLDEGFDAAPMIDTALYTMQRVWPLPPQASATIQEKFFPPKYRVGAYNFIARVYIGQELDPQMRFFFNHNNFPLGVQRLHELGLPVAQLAHDVGLMLGSINFVVEKDGRDIEFVEGGDAVHSLSELQYFCVDFNQMRDLHGLASNIVESFLINDPYYPRPGTQYWHDFTAGHFEAAGEGKHLDLARAVVAGIEEHFHIRRVHKLGKCS